MIFDWGTIVEVDLVVGCEAAPKLNSCSESTAERKLLEIATYLSLLSKRHQQVLSICHPLNSPNPQNQRKKLLAPKLSSLSPQTNTFIKDLFLKLGLLVSIFGIEAFSAKGFI